MPRANTEPTTQVGSLSYVMSRTISHPDAILFDLCARFHRQHAMVLAIPDDDQAALIRAEAAERAIADRIQDIAPVTRAGLRAKAQVALAGLGEHYASGMYIGNDLAFVWALLSDLAGEA